MTGYGRTGHWFGAQHFGIEPDIIVTAKGTHERLRPARRGARADAIADVATSEGFPIGYTYNGHPTSCAVALANLDVIEREGLLARARDVGADCSTGCGARGAARSRRGARASG